MPSSRFPPSLWLGAFFAFGFLSLAWLLGLVEMRQREAPLPVLGQIGDFTLTNQGGRATTLADLTNRVWVADIIFTRCAGECPRMTQQMKSVEDLLPAQSHALLVSLTTDPDYDSPAILKRYGEHYGANFDRWTFLTGTKSEIAGLAANSLKLSAVPIQPADRKSPVDLFIHTTIFVVVDKHARLRAIFQTSGDGVDWTNTVEPQLLWTIRQLERES
ncbi:MAG: SCO family protein [Limisphaerales bacterium]